MYRNKKKGMAFVEIIIVLFIVTTICMIVQQTALLMYLRSQSNISIEANRLVKSYVIEGKALCMLNQSQSPWIYSDDSSLSPKFPAHKINGLTYVDIVISCTTVSKDLKKINVSISIPYLNKVITGEGFIN